MKITPELNAKYHELQRIIQQFNKALIAYSGGVDSVLLLKVTADSLGAENTLAVIGDSESLARSELDKAQAVAEMINVKVHKVYPEEMHDPLYQSNPAERCFYCKSHLYKLLCETAEQLGYSAVFCGTNTDDLSDFRPGLRAARKFNVLSPLEKAGLAKSEIRTLSQYLNLPTWDKPAHPCLASRIPYNESINPAKLKQIERGEEFLGKMGLKNYRVRHHGNLVRIEAPVEMLDQMITEPNRQQLIDFFKAVGFTYVTLDLQGFRSGSGNEIL